MAAKRLEAISFFAAAQCYNTGGWRFSANVSQTPSSNEKNAAQRRPCWSMRCALVRMKENCDGCRHLCTGWLWFLVPRREVSLTCFSTVAQSRAARRHSDVYCTFQFASRTPINTTATSSSTCLLGSIPNGPNDAAEPTVHRHTATN